MNYVKFLLCFVLGCVLSLHNVSSQIPVKKIRLREPYAGITELFTVRKDDIRIRQGAYAYKYKHHKQVEGWYYENRKEGTWVYSPVKNYTITGTYRHDLKEGCWIYVIEGDTLSLVNYSGGLLEGVQKGYYRNGNIASEAIFHNGKPDGIKKVWYENGQLKKTISSREGKLDGDYSAYWEDGTLLYILSYANETPVNLDVKNEDPQGPMFTGDLINGDGMLISWQTDPVTQARYKYLERNFRDSLLHGAITGYDDKGRILYTGQYEKGCMVGTWQFFSDGNPNREKEYRKSQNLQHDTAETSLRFIEFPDYRVDPMPSFDNNGIQQFRMFIRQNLRYPPLAAESNIQGKVFVQFAVNNLGKVVNARVVGSVDPLLDEEALRTVNLSPYWTPGMNKGLPLKVQFTFPVVFILR